MKKPRWSRAILLTKIKCDFRFPNECRVRKFKSEFLTSMLTACSDVQKLWLRREGHVHLKKIDFLFSVVPQLLNKNENVKCGGGSILLSPFHNIFLVYWFQVYHICIFQVQVSFQFPLEIHSSLYGTEIHVLGINLNYFIFVLPISYGLKTTKCGEQHFMNFKKCINAFLRQRSLVLFKWAVSNSCRACSMFFENCLINVKSAKKQYYSLYVNDEAVDTYLSRTATLCSWHLCYKIWRAGNNKPVAKTVHERFTKTFFASSIYSNLLSFLNRGT